MKQASVQAKSYSRRTPEDPMATRKRVTRLLHDSISTSIDINTFRKLLELGPDVNSTDAKGRTVLQKAVALGDDEKIDALRKAGAKK